jgi:hypothetical protein
MGGIDISGGLGAMSGKKDEDTRETNSEKDERTDGFNSVKPSDIPEPDRFNTKTLNSKVSV